MPRPSTLLKSPRFRNIATIVSSGLAILLVALLCAASYTQMSPYDEPAHFDYVVQVTEEGLFPAVGSHYSEVTRDELSCRGTPMYLDEPRCANPIQPQEMITYDVNYVLRYAPIYHGFAALVATVVHSVTGLSLFIGARIASALLYAAGAALLTAAMMRFGARRWVALALPLMVFSVPSLLFQGATVTPDSMALLSGAAGVFILTLKTSWRRRMIIMVIAAILVSLVKANFVPLSTLMVLTAAVFPGTTDNDTGRARWLSLGWKRIVASIGLAILPVAVTYAWNAVRILSVPEGQSADGGIGDYLATEESFYSVVMTAIRTLLSPMVTSSYTISNDLLTTATVAQFLVFGGGIAIALVGKLDVGGKARTLAFAGVAALGLSFVFLPATFYVLNHAVGTQPRYTMPIIPFFTAAISLVITGKVETIVVASIGILFYLMSLADLVVAVAT